MNEPNPAVTEARCFCSVDKQLLFAVNAGIPLEQALEQASHLLGCIETLVLCQGSVNDPAERVTLQYLTEMTRALVGACQPQEAAPVAGRRLVKATLQASGER